MGWQVGDRIAIASTEQFSKGFSHAFRITSLGLNSVGVDSPSTELHKADFINKHGVEAVLMSAEVINLSRNIIITGDDFTHIPCDSSVTNEAQGCKCESWRTKCTTGLHTLQANTGVMKITNTRVEKCGQRGIQGKYCLHGRW
mmetsp:Transcript_12639/g.19596  ORF Transcript_12639/g.19596 Transcript_12639/m.19596 type:complete len:143 (+) Transcript_12639:3-431(+)